MGFVEEETNNVKIFYCMLKQNRCTRTMLVTSKLPKKSKYVCHPKYVRATYSTFSERKLAEKKSRNINKQKKKIFS